MSDSDFNTPPWLLDQIEKLTSDRKIGLDPCSNANSLVGARTCYAVETNGLAHSWRNHGLVFMNPPHSMSPNNIEPWVDKVIAEFGDDSCCSLCDQFVGLVPAKTDTNWFHVLAAHSDSMCFLKGRPKFWHNGVETKGPGKFPSMLIYIGPKASLFNETFAPYGWIPQLTSIRKALYAS